MKVTRNTNDLLVLDHIPWVMSIGLALLVLLFVGIGLIPLGQSSEPMSWLFSGMFIFVGGGLWLMALGLFAKRLQFIFDRSADRITLRRRSIFGHDERRHKLSRLIEARIETSLGENGNAMYRPILVLRSTRSGEAVETPVEMHSYFTNGSGPERICETVNQWLSDSAKSRVPDVGR